MAWIVGTIFTFIYVFEPHESSLESKLANKSVLIVPLCLTIDVDRVLRSTDDENELYKILDCLQNTIERTTVLSVGATVRYRASICNLTHA